MIMSPSLIYRNRPTVPFNDLAVMLRCLVIGMYPPIELYVLNEVFADQPARWSIPSIPDDEATAARAYICRSIPDTKHIDVQHRPFGCGICSPIQAEHLRL